jgi:hypothetical protein
MLLAIDSAIDSALESPLVGNTHLTQASQAAGLEENVGDRPQSQSTSERNQVIWSGFALSGNRGVGNRG